MSDNLELQEALQAAWFDLEEFFGDKDDHHLRAYTQEELAAWKHEFDPLYARITRVLNKLQEEAIINNEHTIRYIDDVNTLIRDTMDAEFTYLPTQDQLQNIQRLIEQGGLRYSGMIQYQLEQSRTSLSRLDTVREIGFSPVNWQAAVRYTHNSLLWITQRATIEFQLRQLEHELAGRPPLPRIVQNIPLADDLAEYMALLGVNDTPVPLMNLDFESKHHVPEQINPFHASDPVITPDIFRLAAEKIEESLHTRVSTSNDTQRLRNEHDEAKNNADRAAAHIQELKDQIQRIDDRKERTLNDYKHAAEEVKHSSFKQAIEAAIAIARFQLESDAAQARLNEQKDAVELKIEHGGVYPRLEPSAPPPDSDDDESDPEQMTEDEEEALIAAFHALPGNLNENPHRFQQAHLVNSDTLVTIRTAEGDELERLALAVSERKEDTRQILHRAKQGGVTIMGLGSCVWLICTSGPTQTLTGWILSILASAFSAPRIAAAIGTTMDAVGRTSPALATLLCMVGYLRHGSGTSVPVASVACSILTLVTTYTQLLMIQSYSGEPFQLPAPRLPTVVLEYTDLIRNFLSPSSARTDTNVLTRSAQGRRFIEPPRLTQPPTNTPIPVPEQGHSVVYEAKSESRQVMVLNVSNETFVGFSMPIHEIEDDGLIDLDFKQDETFDAGVALQQLHDHFNATPGPPGVVDRVVASTPSFTARVIAPAWLTYMILNELTNPYYLTFTSGGSNIQGPQDKPSIKYKQQQQPAIHTKLKQKQQTTTRTKQYDYITTLHTCVNGFSRIITTLLLKDQQMSEYDRIRIEFTNRVLAL